MKASALLAIAFLLIAVPSFAVEVALVQGDRIDASDDSIVLVFGDDTILIGDNASDRAGAVMLASDADGGQLYLVSDRRPAVQRTGYISLYSRAGIHVAIIEDAEALARIKDVRLKPADRSGIVLSRSKAARGTPDPDIESLVNSLGTTTYAAYVSALSVDRSTRFACSDEILAARDVIQQHFDWVGLTTSTPSYIHPCVFCDLTQAYNVVGIKTGATRPEDIYVVGGHYDSMSESPCESAPGANDNASGAAGVMELARAFADVETEATIIFVAFDSEELGLGGSYAFVRSAQAGDFGGTIKGFIAMDMISFYEDDYAVSVESSEATTEQAEKMTEIVELAGTYTDLGVETNTDYWGSDHVPFLDKGYGGALLIELDWDQDLTYHTTGDVYANQDFDYGIEILKLAAASLAMWAVIIPGVDDDATDDAADDAGDDTQSSDDTVNLPDDEEESGGRHADDDDDACGC